MTLGQPVRVEVSGAAPWTGTAVDVDPTGALVVDAGGGRRRTVFAADVVHLRPAYG